MRYAATLTKEGKHLLIDFPDCPGCSTFVKLGENPLPVAAEALEGWLESRLASGDAPERPKTRVSSKGVGVDIPLRLAFKLLVRWARHEAGLSQAALAKKAGVTQQAIAKIEHPDSNPTLETLDKIATALERHWDTDLPAEPKRKAG